MLISLEKWGTNGKKHVSVHELMCVDYFQGFVRTSEFFLRKNSKALFFGIFKEPVWKNNSISEKKGS